MNTCYDSEHLLWRWAPTVTLNESRNSGSDQSSESGYHEQLDHKTVWRANRPTYPDCHLPYQVSAPPPTTTIVYPQKRTYHEDPWGAQGPKHTQQKSALHAVFLQIMWLQPPSFSIVTWHFGHS